MAAKDYMKPEVAVAVAVTAALSSPRVRGILRRGAVYGMAGVLMAGDAVSSATRSATRAAQQVAASAKKTTEDANEQLTADTESDDNSGPAEVKSDE